MIGVIVAHPDDETLGMGGTIVRLAQDNEVHLLCLSRGRPSESDDRRVQFYQAASTLRVTTWVCRDLPDNQFDVLPLLTIVRLVEGWLQEVKPTVVYTHSSADLNIDHRLTFQAVLTATRPRDVKDLYSFEVLSSTEWAFGQFGGFNPNVFMRLAEEDMAVKLAALRWYETETRAWPHPRSEEALMARAKYWGSVIGVDYAEAFEVVRSIR